MERLHCRECGEPFFEDQLICPHCGVRVSREDAFTDAIAGSGLATGDHDDFDTLDDIDADN